MKRVSGSPDVSLMECTNPRKGLWRIRWDLQTTEDGSATYMEEQFSHMPTTSEVDNIVRQYYNGVAEQAILTGMQYDGVAVWLSTENQLNYKAAYDLAVQTDGQNLPITFKFGTEDAPQYRTFSTVSELQAFYMAVVNHINTTLQSGWTQKDAFEHVDYVREWSEYVGRVVDADTLITHDGSTYIVMQSVTPIISQPPSAPGMLAIYKCYQGRYRKPWLSGEYTKVGFTRFDGKVLYEAIQDPGANVHRPSQVPAIWRKV